MKTNDNLGREIEELRIRLSEAESLLKAIRSGAVDAFITDDQKVYTLESADQSYRVLVETMNEGAASLAPDGAVMYCNGHLAELLELPMGHIIGRPVVDFVAPDEVPAFESFLARSRTETVRSEFRFAVKEKRTIPVLVSCNALKAQFSGICMVVTDLTEQKEVQRELEKHRENLEELVAERTYELEESEKKYRALVENAPVGMFEIDFRDMKLTRVNDVLCEVLGYSREELLSINPIDLLEGEYKHVFLERIRSMTAGRRVPESVVYQVRMKSGGTRWVLLNVNLIREGGYPVRARVTATDITDRKQVEADLAYVNSQIKTLLKEAPVGFAYFDLELRYVLINERLAEINGIPAGSHIGRNVKDILPDLAPEVDKITSRILETGEAVRDIEFEGETLKKPGVRRNWNESWYPVHDENGAIVGFGAVVEEITKRKKAERILREKKETVERLVDEKTAQLVNARLELEKAKRLSDIGTLAATVAHELRNPLAAIGMAVYNIGRKSKDQKLDNHIRNIQKKIDESDQIINNLLFYSRIKEPHLEEVNIRRLINEAAENLRNRIKNDLSLIKKIKDMRDVSVRADPVQLREVINNILNNSFDAVPFEGGWIEVSAKVKDGKAQIAVKDNGEGIDPEILDNVFDPFFTTKAKGTGLGLPVCRQIVRTHGGSIDIESEAGEGTTVTVALPLSE